MKIAERRMKVSTQITKGMNARKESGRTRKGSIFGNGVAVLGKPGRNKSFGVDLGVKGKAKKKFGKSTIESGA